MPEPVQLLLLGATLVAIALLAIFDIIPQEVAQYAPLALLALFARVWPGHWRRCLPAREY